MQRPNPFVEILQCINSNVVYETMTKVILSDDGLDDKIRVQRLIDLMHSYKKVKSCMEVEHA